MLQWKPRLIALLVIAASIAAFAGQFGWLYDQLGW